jgi:hypothetical protein
MLNPLTRPISPDSCCTRCGDYLAPNGFCAVCKKPSFLRSPPDKNSNAALVALGGPERQGDCTLPAADGQGVCTTVPISQIPEQDVKALALSLVRHTDCNGEVSFLPPSQALARLQPSIAELLRLRKALPNSVFVRLGHRSKLIELQKNAADLRSRITPGWSFLVVA